MIKTAALLLFLFLTGILFAQDVNLRFAVSSLEIDGFAEEAWDASQKYPINKNFKSEIPSVNATWQAMLDRNYFYVLIEVEDDDHWPGWEALGESYMYDMPEIYFDVNKELKDGKGAKDGAGHYQFAEGFIENGYDAYFNPHIVAGDSIKSGGTFVYSLNKEGYVYEIAVPLSNLKDASGVELSIDDNRRFGFDVTIIDQDEGVTTSRQRCVWSNDGNGNNGSTDESWNNMDGAGRVFLELLCCDTSVVENQLQKWQLKVSPNPVVDLLSIQGVIDNVQFFNSLGALVKETAVVGKTVSVSELPNGVYIVKAYKNGQFRGVAKIIKN